MSTIETPDSAVDVGEVELAIYREAEAAAAARRAEDAMDGMWAARPEEREPTAARMLGRVVAAIVVAFLLVLGGVIAASRADASRAPATRDDRAVEVFWALPDGGTPESVTWPQTYSPAGAVECGVWYQVDTYKVADVEDLIADGILTHGEDHGVAISWRFVYGGDCTPPFVPERFEEERTNGPLEPNCEAPSVTWETWTVEWFSNEDGTFTEPVELAESRTPHEDTLTAEEELACNPPTDPPTTPEEPTDPPAVPEEPTTPVEPPDMTTQRVVTPDVPVLAETGAGDTSAALAVGGLALILLGAGLVAVRRIRGRR
ncbi:LPXTG cell wall anchor domain-containing protein [Pseudactinotalea suaedae]|uniref:LPXTG cell wall anchor domain-containing protein n=1 Tax=Pseudactinotalea suaedae TaxID=1524924 RepID=UPI0012E1851D|nr:LPXTG cell wall anchor domain-containing protein [Pseudactinotalea suaedae]